MDERAKSPAPSMKAEVAAEYGPSPMAREATQLMLAVKSGDRTAFDDLVGRLRPRAFRVAHALVGSRDDAMELAQETFLKVYKARDSFQEGEPFLPWFHRILRNTCFSFLRSKGRLKPRSLSGHPAGADEDEGDYEIADASSPASGAMQNERVLAFREAWSKLAARDREILSLRHFDELAYKEIADALGIPEGTVMSRLFHARRRLRDALGGSFEDQVGVGDDDGGGG